MSTLSAIVQIIKVNEMRSGQKDGRAWQLQDCECVLLNEDHSPSQVGVLSLPRDLRGDKAPKLGIYSGQFTLTSSLSDRKIIAQLVGLIPVPTKQTAAKA